MPGRYPRSSAVSRVPEGSTGVGAHSLPPNAPARKTAPSQPRQRSGAAQATDGCPPPTAVRSTVAYRTAEVKFCPFHHSIRSFLAPLGAPQTTTHGVELVSSQADTGEDYATRIGHLQHRQGLGRRHDRKST